MTPARHLAAATAAVAASAILSACRSDDTGPATVTVLAGGPVEGVEVLFHDPDGSVRSRVFTGADGEATAVVAPGALATVAWFTRFPPPQGGYTLETVAELNPGEAVVVGSSRLPVPTGQVDVTLPGTYAGAAGYRVDIGCNYVAVSAADAPVSVLVRSPCGSTVSAVAVAIAPGGSALAFSTATDVPLSGAPPALAGSIALPAWRTDFGELDLAASNAPAGASMLYSTLAQRRNGVWFPLWADAVPVVPGGSAALVLPFVGGLGDSAQLEVSLLYGTAGAYDGSGLWSGNDVDLSSPRSLDLAAVLPSSRRAGPRLGPTRRWTSSSSTSCGPKSCGPAARGTTSGT